ncbi:MAG: PhnD/SsuA/transferrin family substrate-binding protein [Chloroflexi bacterium]|nr:PhnD/SsuA/transferrin family substrate-binding protein [Chloroflexota bacterium]
MGFICGLPYVRLAEQNPAPVELLAAPVLQGERYQGHPVYFSDVIVRRDSPFQAFSDLRGCVWAYNEPGSHSGYNVTRYRLAQLGETQGYFSRVVKAGSHQNALRLVCKGQVDASAIDSQVLAIELRDHPELAPQLRVIDVLGPSPIQPVVAARQLPDSVKANVQAVLLAMSADPTAKAGLAPGFVEGFAPVKDTDYNAIREMITLAEIVRLTGSKTLDWR